LDGGAHPYIDALRRRYAVDLQMQVGSDLGVRMSFALSQTLGPQGGALLIGSDCPHYHRRLLRRAAGALDAADAVVVPAEDGGYVLIGLRAPQPALFEGVDWGGASVLQQTRHAARAAGLRLVELPPVWDIDRPADLRRLCRRRGWRHLASRSEANLSDA
jgi:rSAM/selenodomain-associated transferase 1